jgi:hypothetical protein
MLVLRVYGSMKEKGDQAHQNSRCHQGEEHCQHLAERRCATKHKVALVTLNALVTLVALVIW